MAQLSFSCTCDSLACWLGCLAGLGPMPHSSEGGAGRLGCPGSSWLWPCNSKIFEFPTGLVLNSELPPPSNAGEERSCNPHKIDQPSPATTGGGPARASQRMHSIQRFTIAVSQARSRAAHATRLHPPAAGGGPAPGCPSVFSVRRTAVAASRARPRAARAA
jgi:hypothetical protein